MSFKKQKNRSDGFHNFYHDDNSKRMHQRCNQSQRQQRYRNDEQLAKRSKRKYPCTDADPSYSRNKNPKVDDSGETNLYFSRLLHIYERGFDDEEQKETFLEKLCEETTNHEIQLSCQYAGSRCIEVFLDNCRNPCDLIRFMKAFSENVETVFMNSYASHISQKLLCSGLKMLMDPDSIIKTSSSTEEVPLQGENKIHSVVLSCICEFAKFCCNNFFNIISHAYGNHVVRTLIQVLGYCFIDKSIFQSQRSQLQKEQAPIRNDDFAEVSKVETSEVPKILTKFLKKIVKQILGNINIRDYLYETSSSTIIQLLLLVTKKRLPKYCTKLVKFLCPEIFSVTNGNSIPLALITVNSSYIIEKVFEVADEEQQHIIWAQMHQYLDPLIQHSVGNFVIQRIFDVVVDQKLFEVMCTGIVPHFDLILERQRFGIWYSMAKACNRLHTQQALFMNTLRECLNCSDPTDRHVYFATLVLSLRKFDSQEGKKAVQLSESVIKLQGSLLLQEILRFQKPVRVIYGILNMTSEELQILACHVQGCHVFTSFFESSFVGEKNRDKLIMQLKPAIINIAMDASGSFTLSKIWLLTSLKQRCIIAEVLSKNQEVLSQQKSSLVLLKKCAIFQYKQDLENWKQIQNRMSKKRDFLKEIIRDKKTD